jgi:hypothetical protein
MPPVALTDQQLTAIMRAAEPLRVGDRDRFLQAVAERLQGRVIGDGEVGRAIREVLPTLSHQPQEEMTASNNLKSMEAQT